MSLDYRSYPVLYVDDEPGNLVTFRYAMEGSFSVHTASGGEEALALMQQERFAVLLADQRMPGMSGSELCQRARAEHPDTVRIIVTAYADLHAAIDAINRGEVSRYLTKPWDNRELEDVLRTAIELVHIHQTVQEMEIRLLRTGQSRVTVAMRDEIAHELASPLTALHMNIADAAEQVEVALRSKDLEESKRTLEGSFQALRDGLAAVEQLTRFTARLRSGDDPVDPLMVSCDVVRVVDSTIRILRSEVEKTADLTVTCDDASFAAIDPSVLGQVILNLVLNAAQAIGSGAQGRAAISVTVGRDASKVRLTVADTGPGIPTQQLEEIFRPYFTTKPDGTGVGLSIVRELVDRAGGQISVESEPGRGTAFAVTLPIASG